LKQKLLGYIAALLTFMLRASLRLTIEVHPKIDLDKNYVLCNWHGKKFLSVAYITKIFKKRPVVAMTSASKDGAILATCLRQLNYKIIRGSSSADNIKALVQLLRALKNGANVGFAVDGPTGPIYKIKPGVIYLSQKSQAPIIPIGCYLEKKHIFTKAWDLFELPYPFTRAKIVLGEPFEVPADLPKTAIDSYLLELEEKMHQTHMLAAKLD